LQFPFFVFFVPARFPLATPSRFATLPQWNLPINRFL
jgi:hypothetical protein